MGRDIRAEFKYYDDPKDGSKPFDTIQGKWETYQQPTIWVEMPVTDISGMEASFTLDKNGFEIMQHVSAEKNFQDEKAVQEYIKEMEPVLKAK